MPNIASLLKAEILRLARKEVRVELGSLRKAVASQRSELALLKKNVRELQARVKQLARVAPTSQGVSNSEESVPRKFSANRMKMHRQKLGLSAKDYGLLIGASGLSVYKWEEGNTKPRDKSLESIGSVLGIGKRQATLMLSEIRAGNR